MKKRILFFLTLVAALAVAIFAVGCDETKVDTGSQSDVCKVVFYENYPGAAKTTVRVKNGEKVSRPADPVHAGYQFKDWYADYEGTTPFDFEKQITSDTKIFAIWSRSNYEITFKLNNGEADVLSHVEIGGKLSRPQDPTRENYRFVDWYTDSGLTSVYDFDSVVSGDMTLYAGWYQLYAKVTYQLNYTGSDPAETVTVETGKTLTPPTAPERDLYSFDGWYLGVGADAKEFDFTSDVVTEDFTLYAHWTRTTFIVTFNANYDGAPAAQQVRVPLNGSAEAPETVRHGYDFEGWYEDAACTTKADLNGVSSDFTVYANWTLHTYTVKFDLNYPDADGDKTPKEQKVEYGKTAQEPEEPEREGFLFAGWYTDAAGSEANSFTFDMTVGDDLTLYAKWIENAGGGDDDSLTVTYHYNVAALGDVYYVQKVDYNGMPLRFDPPEDPDVEGYLFVNWYMEPECVNLFNNRTRIQESIDVYARLLKEYEFQAEMVDFGGKSGVGGSVNYIEDGMIISGSFIRGGDVHGGYYVTGLYNSGLYIDFEITAENDVKEAILEMRVSSEMKDFRLVLGEELVLPSSMFQIIVNGTYNALGEPLTGEIKHDGIKLPLANLEAPEDLDPDKTPFIDWIVYRHLELKKGANVIRFRTNNVGTYGGTFNAVAPMIDSITIYSEIGLTMKEYPQWLEKKLEKEGGAVAASLPAILPERKEW